MGSVQTPFFPNLFLFYFEWQYINNLKEKNVILALKFCYASRFIDDLITINNHNFKKNNRNTYPAELKIKKRKPNLKKC